MTYLVYMHQRQYNYVKVSSKLYWIIMYWHRPKGSSQTDEYFLIYGPILKFFYQFVEYNENSYLGISYWCDVFWP